MIAPLWTVIAFRAGRVSRRIGRPVSWAQAERIAKNWNSPAQRAVYRDEAQALAITWSHHEQR
jgi:hypothetical protein